MAEMLVRCPDCGVVYRVNAALRGRIGRCAGCRRKFVLEPVEPDGAVEVGGPAVWRRGDVILDLYEVKGVLGEGGMGTVYRVRHRDWGLDLAVKCPRPEVFLRPGGAEDFEREAETWVNLGLHPHTVSCFYVRRLDGVPRVFVEYVAGGTLHDWISGARGRPPRLYDGGRTAPSSAFWASPSRLRGDCTTPTRRASSTRTSSPPT